MEELTIIIPVFNCEKYIESCIESIIKQTFTNFKVCIIDDGSTDNTCKIIQKYQKQDSRIYYYHQKNKGVSAARNRGIRLTETPYLMFVDSDDVLDSSICEKLMHLMEMKADMAFCGFKRCFYRENRLIKCSYVLPECSSIQSRSDWGEHYGRLYENTILIAAWAKIFRTELIKSNSIYFNENMALAEDVIFNQEYQRFCNCIVSINEPLYTYNCYFSPLSLTNKFNDKRFITANFIFQETNKFCEIKEILPETKKYILKVYYKDCINYLESVKRNKRLKEAKKVLSDPTLRHTLNEKITIDQPALYIYHLIFNCRNSVLLSIFAEMRKKVKYIIRGG